MNLGQRNAAARRILVVDTPGKNWGRALKARMMQQQPRQLRARVSGHSHYRGLYSVSS